MTGRLGGGNVTFGGRIGLDGFAIGDLSLTAIGERMTLRYPEGFRSIIDADLGAAGDDERARAQRDGGRAGWRLVAGASRRARTSSTWRASREPRSRPARRRRRRRCASTSGSSRRPACGSRTTSPAWWRAPTCGCRAPTIGRSSSAAPRSSAATCCSRAIASSSRRAGASTSSTRRGSSRSSTSRPRRACAGPGSRTC